MALPHLHVIKNIPKNGCLLLVGKLFLLGLLFVSRKKTKRRYLVSMDCNLSRELRSCPRFDSDLLPLTYSITLYLSLSVYFSLLICLGVRPEGALWSYIPPFVFSSIWPKRGWTDGWMAGWERVMRRSLEEGHSEVERQRETREQGKYVLHPADFQPVSSVDRPNRSGGGSLRSSVWPLTPLHNTAAAGLTFHHRLVLFPLILFQLAYFFTSFR